jgi:hypothetical protein
VSGEKPEGVETQEGNEEPAGLITLSVASNRCSDQDPGGDAAGAGAVEATRREAKVANDKRVRVVDEAAGLGSGRKPLNGESRTWLRGETNPQGSRRSKPSRA